MKFENICEANSCESILVAEQKKLKLAQRYCLLYHREGFLKQTLLKVNSLTDYKLKIKIYATNENQILALLQTIQTEYEENVVFTLNTMSSDLIRLKLQEGLRAECLNLLEPQLDWMKQIDLETETDRTMCNYYAMNKI